MRSSTTKIIFTALVTAIIIGSGIYTWQQNKIDTLAQTNTKKTLQVSTTTSTGTPTDTWETYISKEFGFEMKIPTDASVSMDLNDQYNRLVSFKSATENFEVRLKKDKETALNDFNYLDFPIVGKSTLAGNEAVIFKAQNGYCDGPGCTPPFISYATKHGDDFYIFTFSGHAELNDTEKSIVASFKFN